MSCHEYKFSEISFCLQPAKLYKLKHLSKVEVLTNDPSGCTFTLVMLHPPRVYGKTVLL